MSEHWSDSQSAAAEARGRELRDTIPYAVAAHYDRRGGKVVIDLSNEATFSFPPGLSQDLREASADDLARIEITPSGFGLYWPALEADLSIPGLLAGRFGTKAWMSELARRAGSVSSPAKAAAARANGAKGGRPRKVG